MGGALDALERLPAESAERYDALDSITDCLERACQHVRDEQTAIEGRAAEGRRPSAARHDTLESVNDRLKRACRHTSDLQAAIEAAAADELEATILTGDEP